MPVQGLEPINHAVSESLETGALRATENTNEVLRKLEWSCLEFETFARRIGQKEPKVDVNQVTVFVKEHIGVVSIFDL